MTVRRQVSQGAPSMWTLLRPAKSDNGLSRKQRDGSPEPLPDPNVLSKLK
jgi:hypothetical protein